MDTSLNIRKRFWILIFFLPWITGVVLAFANVGGSLRSPLQQALEARRFNEAKSLISASSINEYRPRTDWFRTPLMIAVHNVNVGLDNNGKEVDWIEIVSKLLEAGADVNEAGWLCYTPLHIAAEGESIQTINLLLSRGARIDRQNCHGQTALFIASEIGKSSLVVQEFLQAGANQNIRTRDGKSALQVAKKFPISSAISEAMQK